MPELSALAKGPKQRLWLQALQNPDEGLHYSDGNLGRFHLASERRVDAFVQRLAHTGFKVEKRHLGPQQGTRWFLNVDDWDPARGEALRLVGAVQVDDWRTARQVRRLSRSPQSSDRGNPDAEKQQRIAALLDLVCLDGYPTTTIPEIVTAALSTPHDELEILVALGATWSGTWAELVSVSRTLAARA